MTMLGSKCLDGDVIHLRIYAMLQRTTPSGDDKRGSHGGPRDIEFQSRSFVIRSTGVRVKISAMGEPKTETCTNVTQITKLNW